MALILGRMTYSSLYVTAFPIEPLLRVISYSVRGDGSVHGRTHTCNVKSQLATSFGGVADRKSKHLS